MKLLCNFFWSILFSTSGFVFAQTQISNVSADFIKLDPFGNIYSVKDAQLSKFSIHGKLLYNFSDYSLGEIFSIDVFNPMKIMLFYKDAGTLLFLNEQLVPINDPISLFDANYYTVALASYSAANQIHLYDNAQKYLITLDFNMREVSKTPINFPSFNPSKIIELEEQNLAFFEPESGVYLFDTFGTFHKFIPVLTSLPVEVTSNEIYYTNNNEINIYNYKLMSAYSQTLPVSTVKQTLQFRNKMIFLLQNGTIWTYE